MASKRAELLDALIQEMPWYISAATRFQIAVADQLGMPLTDVHAIGAVERRIEGARVEWSRSWQASLDDDLIERIKAFVEAA